MQISVTGEERRTLPPERAELQLSVTAQSTNRARAVADATASANGLAEQAAGLQQRGAVTRYVVRPLRTSVWRRSSRSEQVTAVVELSITFADFEELGRVTGEWATHEDVHVGWVRWFLTDETMRRLTDECIEGAVQRARVRAEAMARAAGAGAVRIVEIADPGLLGAQDPTVHLGGAPRPMALARSATLAPAEEPVQIVPEPIEIGAQLQLRFHAD